MAGFIKFDDSLIKFLRQLEKNNDREWFAKNKSRYEEEVLFPALAFVEAFGPALKKISPHFRAVPKRVGGSVMRVYRDTRFSKDKTPYKTNIGIQFRHAAGKDVHAPGFYLNIEPGAIFLAAGIWAPDNPTLHKVRTLIDEYPDEWKKIARNLTNKKAGFQFHEGSLKKAPKGFPNDHPLLEDLKRKHFVVVKQVSKKDIQGKAAAANTAALFKKAAPLVQFVCEAVELDF